MKRLNPVDVVNICVNADTIHCISEDIKIHGELIADHHKVVTELSVIDCDGYDSDTMFGIDIPILSSETAEAIKQLLINDLSQTIIDLNDEIDRMKKNMMKYM